jgi:hypothetical protein
VRTTLIVIDPSLLSGTVANIIGKDGEVQISQTGKVKKYSIDINFNRASFVNAGLTASGELKITWQP